MFSNPTIQKNNNSTKDCRVVFSSLLTMISRIKLIKQSNKSSNPIIDYAHLSTNKILTIHYAKIYSTTLSFLRRQETIIKRSEKRTIDSCLRRNDSIPESKYSVIQQSKKTIIQQKIATFFLLLSSQ